MAKHPGNAKGLALPLIVGIISILTMLIVHTHLVSRQRVRLARTLTERTYALALARSAVVLSWEVLSQDDRPYFSLPETSGDGFLGDSERPSDLERAYLWLHETTVSPRSFEGGKISVRLTDDMGRISLNRANVDSLASIIQRLGIMIRDETDIFGSGLLRDRSLEMACAIVDWRDADSIPEQGLGAEEPYYQNLSIPYRPRNAPFPTVGELLLVRDFSREILFGTSRPAHDLTTGLPLYPHVTTFGSGSQININTAPRIVLQSLPGIHEFAAQEPLVDEIIRNRPYRTMGDLRQIVTAQAPDVWNQLFPAITLASNRFRVVIDAWSRGGVSVTLEAILLKQGRRMLVLSWKEQ